MSAPTPAKILIGGFSVAKLGESQKLERFASCPPLCNENVDPIVAAFEATHNPSVYVTTAKRLTVVRGRNEVLPTDRVMVSEITGLPHTINKCLGQDHTLPIIVGDFCGKIRSVSTEEKVMERIAEIETKCKTAVESLEADRIKFDQEIDTKIDAVIQKYGNPFPPLGPDGKITKAEADMETEIRAIVGGYTDKLAVTRREVITLCSGALTELSSIWSTSVFPVQRPFRRVAQDVIHTAIVFYESKCNDRAVVELRQLELDVVGIAQKMHQNRELGVRAMHELSKWHPWSNMDRKVCCINDILLEAVKRGAFVVTTVVDNTAVGVEGEKTIDISFVAPGEVPESLDPSDPETAVQCADRTMFAAYEMNLNDAARKMVANCHTATISQVALSSKIDLMVQECDAMRNMWKFASVGDRIAVFTRGKVRDTDSAERNFWYVGQVFAIDTTGEIDDAQVQSCIDAVKNDYDIDNHQYVDPPLALDIKKSTIYSIDLETMLQGHPDREKRLRQYARHISHHPMDGRVVVPL